MRDQSDVEELSYQLVVSFLSFVCVFLHKKLDLKFSSRYCEVRPDNCTVDF